MFRFDEAFRREFPSNWLPLATAFVCLLFGLSSSAFSGPFLYPEVIAEFGWSREQATLYASAKYLFASVGALLFGLVIDRLGVWVTLLFLMTLAGCAMAMWIWMSSLTMYYVSGAMTGVAVGAGAMAIKVLVARSFHASHGTAFGIVLMGSAVAGTVIPPIIVFLIAKLGWRNGFAAMSLSVWFVVIPFLIIGYYRSRRPLGPMQADHATLELSSTTASAAEQGSIIARARECLRQKNFWMIALAGMFISAVDAAFFQHQVLILKDLKFSPATVISVVSIMGLISVGARLVAGNILDSASNKGLACLYLMLLVTCVAAPFLGVFIVLAIFVLCRAVGQAAVLLDIAVMTKHAFGIRNLGMLFSFMSVFSQIGLATGPWLMGRIFDATGSYDIGYAILACFCVAAAVLAWNIKPTYWLEMNRQADTLDGPADPHPIPSAARQG
jgi:MFS family permease